MKITLKKDWKYWNYGDYTWKRGMVIYNSKRAKNVPKYSNGYRDGWVKDDLNDGWCINHFYSFGQNEVIPKEYLKIEK